MLNETNKGTVVSKRISEFFDVGNVDVQMSRLRFVFAGVPPQADTWRRIQAEYRAIKRAYAEEDAANGLAKEGANP